VASGARPSPGWPAVAVLCLGVWLHAADSLLAATVMPSAIAEIGGVAFIYWTVALYQLGSIVAGAITGILAIRLGLRAAMTIAALIYGAGCTVSALAPDMAAMLLGRLLQGLGGWMMALSHVGVTRLFPARRWPQLLAVISGVWGVQATSLAALLLVALGLALLATALSLERRRNQLFPPHPLDLRRPWGAGYVMVLALSIATVSFTVYGPLLMETLFGVTPLVAGVMIAVESVSWTIAAIVFAGAGARQEPALIRGGAVAITLGIAGLAWTMPQGPVAALVPWVVLLGAGFGMCWAFVMRRVVESVAESERERAASSLPTIQLLGYALGAALSGIVANLSGLAADASRGVLEGAAFWVFAAFLPLAVLGVAAAWRLARGAESTS